MLLGSAALITDAGSPSARATQGFVSSPADTSYCTGVRYPRLQSGEVPNQAAIARQEGITRGRVTQVMGLLRLAPRSRSTSCPSPTWSAGRRSLSGRCGPSRNTRGQRYQMALFRELIKQAE